MRNLTPALILLILSTTPTFSHEAATGQDYSKYRQPNGASCCNGRDCRPVAYEMRSDGSVVMYPAGQVVVVPRARINKMPSKDGLGHWCGFMLPTGGAMTFCAILPMQVSRLPEVERSFTTAAICHGRGAGAPNHRPPPVEEPALLVFTSNGATRLTRHRPE
jgi:hypothetical protein